VMEGVRRRGINEEIEKDEDKKYHLACAPN
jgi:hypothetical protein